MFLRTLSHVNTILPVLALWGTFYWSNITPFANSQMHSWTPYDCFHTLEASDAN